MRKPCCGAAERQVRLGEAPAGLALRQPIAEELGGLGGARERGGRLAGLTREPQRLSDAEPQLHLDGAVADLVPGQREVWVRVEAGLDVPAARRVDGEGRLGQPRVAGDGQLHEIIDCGRPKDAAVITEIDGTVSHGPIAKGMRKVIITGDDGETREYLIPRYTHVNVQEVARAGTGPHRGRPGLG